MASSKNNKKRRSKAQNARKSNKDGSPVSPLRSPDRTQASQLPSPDEPVFHDTGSPQQTVNALEHPKSSPGMSSLEPSPETSPIKDADSKTVAKGRKNSVSAVPETAKPVLDFTPDLPPPHAGDSSKATEENLPQKLDTKELKTEDSFSDLPESLSNTAETELSGKVQEEEPKEMKEQQNEQEGYEGLNEKAAEGQESPLPKPNVSKYISNLDEPGPKNISDKKLADKETPEFSSKESLPGPISDSKPTLGSPFHADRVKPVTSPTPSISEPPKFTEPITETSHEQQFDDDINLDELDDLDDAQVVSAVPVSLSKQQQPPASEKGMESPQIPQRSAARIDTGETFEARRQTLGVAKPVMVVDNKESNEDSDFDPDQYFSGSEDEIVNVDPQSKEPEKPQTEAVDAEAVDADVSRVKALQAETPQAVPQIEVPESNQTDDRNQGRESVDFNFSASPKQTIRKVDSKRSSQPSEDHKVRPSSDLRLASPLASPQASPQRPEDAYNALNGYSPERQEGLGQLTNQELHPKSPELDHIPRLEPPNKRFSMISLSSGNSPPKPYKYEQSPLPTETDPSFHPEPPIFGVGVVGFHHQRGPEVEYFVGPDKANSNMWPYLPFQSLPDGSHQFEENISYFTLLYDRNKATSTSLTFTRNDEGHIQAGTSDFRDVTTLFGIACSRQIPVEELDPSKEENQEYTRSVVQKSVFVIASKPIFGPIKEKLTVVTRSYFDQRDFSDHAIIDNFYANLVQMPLWINENDLQVGMNLQRFVHDFGEQVLVILKAVLLECKILFYANDTDVLGTTQFALISLIPNLINHLQDSGSPLLSSYEVNLETPAYFKTSDRQSVLSYCGFPLQVFAGGGVFSPFIPLQQFDDLKQPETRYGMMGTTNNLFLGSDIDFDMVVNIDTHKVEIRKNSLVPLLKLSDQDRAFAQKIVENVNQAWDVEDRWHPHAMGYVGGEDYIRHEIEEYLLALVASAKDSEKDVSDNQSNSSHSSQQQRGNLTAWNKQWVDGWMATNNFRIFDRHTDPSISDLVSTEHPGAKFVKPSGLERFLGLFRKPSPPEQLPVTTLANPPRSGASSVVHTPTLGGEDKFEPVTPAEGSKQVSTQATPKSWFRQ